MKLYSLPILALTASTLVGCWKLRSSDLAVPQQPAKPLEAVSYSGPREYKVEQPPAPPPPAAPGRITQTEDLKTKFNSKIDILVEVDTSDSMYCDQEKLDKNIDKFIGAFLKKQGKQLDFRIGVVSVWDSVNFKDAHRDCALGELRPVGGKNAASNGSCTANRGKINYVTRETPDLVNTLAATLKLGTETFIKNDPVHSGPEKEELFSPVVAALSQEMAAANNNFRRADAHLAVVIFSDADDSTPDISPDQMAQYIKNQATEDLSVFSYAVLARYNDLLAFEKDPSGHALREYPRAAMKNCKVNPVDPDIRGAGKGPFRMHEFLQKAGGVGLDLMDPNYGNKIADIGQSIVRKVLRKEILLKSVPDISQPIVVKYGKQTIKKDDNKGWFLDNNNPQVLVINGDIDIEYDKNAQITVEFTPARN